MFDGTENLAQDNFWNCEEKVELQLWTPTLSFLGNPKILYHKKVKKQFHN